MPMSIPKLHVPAACPRTGAFSTSTLAVFSRGDVKRAPHTAVEAMVEAAEIFLNRIILHATVHVRFKLGTKILKINCAMAFLL
jgi:hypothetical protein